MHTCNISIIHGILHSDILHIYNMHMHTYKNVSVVCMCMPIHTSHLIYNIYGIYTYIHYPQFYICIAVLYISIYTHICTLFTYIYLYIY